MAYFLSLPLEFTTRRESGRETTPRKWNFLPIELIFSLSWGISIRMRSLVWAKMREEKNEKLLWPTHFYIKREKLFDGEDENGLGMERRRQERDSNWSDKMLRHKFVEHFGGFRWGWIFDWNDLILIASIVPLTSLMKCPTKKGKT